MITYSIIQKSQLEGACRIDAEYYQPEYLEITQQIKLLKIPIKKLYDLIETPVITGTTPKQRECKNDDTDVKFIKTDVLRDGEIDFEQADCLPLKQSREFSQPKTGDILTTIIGADYPIVGRSALVFYEDPVMNINQNIVRIRPNSSLLSEYLITFLRSKFGILQLWQQSRQTEQVNLNCREVENILIPIFDLNIQEEFRQLVNNSKQQKTNSITFYNEAENLLLEELGLKDFEVKDDLSYVVNLSDVKSANRLDSDYFQPKYEKLIEKINRKELKRLKEVSNRVKINIKPQKNILYKYIEIGDINVVNGNLNFNEIEGKNLPASATIPLKGKELIISKVRPTRGAISIVPDNYNNNFICSNAFSVFEVNDILKEYLFVVLRSIVGKLQMEKPTTGTSYPTITDGDVENIAIPILQNETQQKIADLVRQSHKARKKSKELLDEAKRKVEEMIEKGGEN